MTRNRYPFLQGFVIASPISFIVFFGDFSWSSATVAAPLVKLGLFSSLRRSMSIDAGAGNFWESLVLSFIFSFFRTIWINSTLVKVSIPFLLSTFIDQQCYWYANSARQMQNLTVTRRGVWAEWSFYVVFPCMHQRSRYLTDIQTAVSVKFDGNFVTIPKNIQRNTVLPTGQPITKRLQLIFIR